MSKRLNPNSEERGKNLNKILFRMHIYDVKTKGSYIGGTKGAVSFKVRGGEEEDTFEIVKKQLKDKLKLNIETTKPKNPKRT